MKLIFLDFDGVLNSLRSCIAFHGYPFPDPNTWYKFDKVAISLMRKLCKETGAKIVLSTTWRLSMNVDEVKAMFHELGFENAPIIGKTPSYNTRGSYSSYTHFSRGEEIEIWLKAYERKDISPALCDPKSLGEEIEAYAIIDDDADMLKEQLPFFVQTSFIDGLTLASFLDMLRILDPKNKELNDIDRAIVRDRPVHSIADLE